MFKIISGMMANCYQLINAFLMTINLCNVKKINCALMFIISNVYGTKRLSILIELVPCNDMLKVVSGIMENWHKLMNTFFIAVSTM